MEPLDQQGSGVAIVTGGSLTVTVVSGSDFPRDLKAGLYCVVKMKDAKGKGIRKTQKATSIVRPDAAFWNETFTFAVERGWKGFTIKCFIKSDGTFGAVKEFIKGHDTPLGKVRVSENLFKDSDAMIDDKMPLLSRKNRASGSFLGIKSHSASDVSSSGTIHIKAAYEPTYEVAGDESADSKDAAKLRAALTTRHFPVALDEQILEGFSCSLREGHLRYIPGRFVVTSLNVFFFSHNSEKYKFQFPYGEISTAKKANSAKIIPSAIDITLKDGRQFHFTNFLHRDSAFALVEGRLNGAPLPVPSLKLKSDGSSSSSVRRSMEATRPRRESVAASSSSTMPITEISPRAASPHTLLSESASGKKLGKQLMLETSTESESSDGRSRSNALSPTALSSNLPSRNVRMSASGSSVVLLPTPVSPQQSSIAAEAQSLSSNLKATTGTENEMKRIIEDIYKSEEAERGSPAASSAQTNLLAPPTSGHAELKRSGPFSAKILEDLAETQKKEKKEKKGHHHRRSHSTAESALAMMNSSPSAPVGASASAESKAVHTRSSTAGVTYASSHPLGLATSPPTRNIPILVSSASTSQFSKPGSMKDGNTSPPSESARRSALRRSPRSSQAIVSAAQEVIREQNAQKIPISGESSGSVSPLVASPNSSNSQLHDRVDSSTVTPTSTPLQTSQKESHELGSELRALRAREERRRQEERGMMLTRLAATSSPLLVTQSPSKENAAFSPPSRDSYLGNQNPPPIPNMNLALPGSPPRSQKVNFMSDLARDPTFRSSPNVLDRSSGVGQMNSAPQSPISAIPGNAAIASPAVPGTTASPLKLSFERQGGLMSSSSSNLSSPSSLTALRPPAIHRERAVSDLPKSPSGEKPHNPNSNPHQAVDTKPPKKRDANFTESLFGLQDVTPQKLLRKLALHFAAILLSSIILPAFQSDTMKDRIEAAGVLAVLSLFLQPILWEMTRWLGYLIVGTLRGSYDKHTEVIGQIVFPILMIPVSNTLLLALVVALVQGFHVSGVWGAFYGSFLMKIIAMLVEKIDADFLVKYWP